MEFEIKGIRYHTAKLDVFQQLKVSRRLLPVLAGLVSGFGTLKSVMVRDSEGKLVFDEKRAFDTLDIVLPEVVNTLTVLPEENVNVVIHPYLGAVMHQHEKRWVKVFDQGVPILDDIDLFTALQLVTWMVADSLGNFLKEPPGSRTSTRPQVLSRNPCQEVRIS